MLPMCGWQIDASARASRSNRARRSGFVIHASGRTLIATSRPSAASRARYTSPMPPAPSGATISYTPSFVPAVSGMRGALFLGGRWRSRNRWRQRRRIDVAARAVRPDRAGAEPQVVLVHVVLAAGVLLQLLVRHAGHPGSGVRERPGVKLRILDQRVDVNVIGVGTRPPLDDVKRVAMRVGVLVDPDFFFLEADGVD